MVKNVIDGKRSGRSGTFQLLDERTVTEEASQTETPILGYDMLPPTTAMTGYTIGPMPWLTDGFSVVLKWP